MRFSADFQGGAPNAAPEERATVADFRVWINEQNVTQHLRGSTNRDRVTIALYGLAEGLAHDWWALFGGRDREFSLIAHRSGYLVPDIRFSFDGSVFEISAHQRVYRDPDVRFWVGPSESLSRADAETALDRLVLEVVGQLTSAGVHDTSLALRWARVQASRDDPDEATFCECAGALGLDPYQISDDASDLIEQTSATFEGEPLAEFLAGARLQQARSLLAWIAEAETRTAEEACLGDLRTAAEEAAGLAPERELEKGWSLGYRRARALRRALGLQASKRFASVPDLARRLGASKHFAAARAVDGLRAVRADQPDGVYIHLRDHGHAVDSQLFSFARAVGDAACFPAPTRAPVNDLRSAHRQAAGRAFAAEFLAPIEDVLAMQRDGRDSITIAETFSVSPVVIERQLENAPRIAEACA